MLTASCLLASVGAEPGLGRPSFCDVVARQVTLCVCACVCVCNINDTWDLYQCRKTGINAADFWERKDQDSNSFCVRCAGIKNFWNVYMIKTQWQCCEIDCGDGRTFLWL